MDVLQIVFIIVVVSLVYLLASAGRDWLGEIGVEIPGFRTWIKTKESKNEQPPLAKENKATEEVKLLANESLEVKEQKVVSHPKLLELTPPEIRSEINKMPPGQRKLGGEAYVGLKVHWKLFYRNIHDLPGDKDMVITHYGSIENGIPEMVSFDLSLDDYPEFRVMHEGTEFWVNGSISRITKLSIDLTVSEVSFK